MISSPSVDLLALAFVWQASGKAIALSHNSAFWINNFFAQSAFLPVSPGRL
jgi:hypothetical protein